MKKHSGFFNRRIISGFVLWFAAIVFALAGFGQTSKQAAAPWPSLQQQLSQDYFGRKIQPGSALEKLVRDNQDFSMLRDDEKSDNRGFPPWLRVWWRKAHPESAYSASDPTGGYPRALHEILEWMLTHQDLKEGPGIAAKGTKRGVVEPDAVIGADLRISGAQSVPRSESDIRINPFDSTKIVSTSNNISSTGKQAVYYSTNGGTSWGQTVLPGTGSDSFHTDPTNDWTSDGRAWSATLGIAGSSLRFRNYFSTDNGATWTFEATASGTQTAVDKELMWADHSASSPYQNQIYGIWHNAEPAYMNRRTAGAGGTWLAAPIQVSGAESSGTCIGGDVKTNRAGDVFGAWPTTGNSRLFVVKSTDGGNSFGTPVQIATTFDTFDIGIPSMNSRRALVYVSLGAYRTMHRDNVYCAWTDLSGDSGCTVPANEPGANINSTCKTRVWFSRSTDGGATWSAKVKLNNQATLNDQFNQALSVDETNGGIGIMYYDTVGDAGRRKTDVWYQSSTDDGVTWSSAQKVTTGMTDETISGADDGNQFGDYNSISAFSNVLFPSWTDRRNLAREEIWTTRINDTFAPAPSIINAGSNIVSGTCGTPAMINPGTTVTVTFCISNNGSASTSNLIGTLLASGGVSNPSGPQNYGALAPGGKVCRPFTFTANAACGGSITASIQFQDGATNLGTLTYSFTVSGMPNTIYTQNFDSVTPPALPSCWNSSTWVTSNSGVPTPVADSSPNSVFVDDPAAVNDKQLTLSSCFSYNSPSAQLNFRQNFDLEEQDATTAYDCGVLEIMINGGAWTDIVSAGGSFVSGGYNHTAINTGFSNPLLPSRPNWSGNSGGFITTKVNLPAGGAGQVVQLRWRMGSDNIGSRQGWRIDNVTVSDGMICAPVPMNAVSRKVHGGAGTFDVDLPTSGTPGVECRSGGMNGDHQVIVTFQNSVTVGGASVVYGTGSVDTFNVNGSQVTVNLTGIANAQTIWISLNNVSDGSNMGCAAIPMSVLLADGNGNGSVNSGDVSQAKLRVGQTVNASNFRSDVNASGTINAGDVSITKANVGIGLP